MKGQIFKSTNYMFLWGLLTLFFAFQFILRLAVGILREDIMTKFSIDTVAFGHLAGYYYLGYAGMQIPLGYALDNYSIKKVAFISIMTTAIGTFMFSMATSWDYLLLSRFVIGAGSSAGFLAVAKVTTTYAAQKHHRMLIALAFTFGLMGAVLGGQPTRMLLNASGIQTGLNILGAICVFIGFFILIFGRSEAPIRKIVSTSEHFKNVIKLLFNPTILFISISGGLMVGTLECFADVWAMPFFNQIYGYSMDASIDATFVLYIGMCVGGPILAFIADKIKSQTMTIFFTSLLVSAIFMLFFIMTKPNFYFVSFLMFVMGILCCYQTLVFTVVSDLVDKNSSALAIAVVNCVNMSFGYLFHIIVSNIMQENWSGAVNMHNAPVYDALVFINSLRIIPILSLIGGGGFLILGLFSDKDENKEN